ncbi:MAG: hypothetical protein NUW37_10455 [Planctomycetes bacterium]|nr:hypothetical protein [Planctomycetota bacterium]
MSTASTVTKRVSAAGFNLKVLIAVCVLQLMAMVFLGARTIGFGRDGALVYDSRYGDPVAHAFDRSLAHLTYSAVANLAIAENVPWALTILSAALVSFSTFAALFMFRAQLGRFEFAAIASLLGFSFPVLMTGLRYSVDAPLMLLAILGYFGLRRFESSGGIVWLFAGALSLMFAVEEDILTLPVAGIFIGSALLSLVRSRRHVGMGFALVFAAIAFAFTFSASVYILGQKSESSVDTVVSGSMDLGFAEMIFARQLPAVHQALAAGESPFSFASVSMIAWLFVIALPAALVALAVTLPRVGKSAAGSGILLAAILFLVLRFILRFGDEIVDPLLFAFSVIFCSQIVSDRAIPAPGFSKFLAVAWAATLAVHLALGFPTKVQALFEGIARERSRSDVAGYSARSDLFSTLRFRDGYVSSYYRSCVENGIEPLVEPDSGTRWMLMWYKELHRMPEDSDDGG